MSYDLSELNKKFEKSSPESIINFVLEQAKQPIVTTNFGPYSASLLHALNTLDASIPIIWADSGYTLSTTYKFIQKLEEHIELNLHIYAPKYTRSYLDYHYVDYMASPEGHQAFTNIVKIEPIKRAFDQHQPDIWFTNIRKTQTTFRESLGIFSKSPSGLLKVSPFYHYDDKRINDYLKKHNLPNELMYFDPTKLVENQECGLHLSVFT